GGYVRFDLPAPAAAAHRSHGDAGPGEELPGSPAFVFGDACELQAVGFAEIEQLTPISATYEALTSENSPEGEMTGNIIPVEINLTGDRANTSGCEASDFAGLDFSGPNDIALMQRSSCEFVIKLANAPAAGAEAAIIFNHGNTPDREGLVRGT